MARAAITMEIVVAKNRLPEINAAIPLILERETKDTAEIIKDHADRAMNQPKSGKTWFVKNRGTGTYQWHTSSAPGEAPAVLSGTLQGSADTEKIDDGWATTWETDYAVRLEFGKGSIAPRPFARPAATAAFPGFWQRTASKIGRV